MNYTNLTLDQLEEQDMKLHRQTDELEESFMYRKKIELYTVMHHKVKQLVRRKQEDQSYLDNIKERLVFNLIHYGTYLKMADQKVHQVAIPSLEKALKYDPQNPIAAYRLGFLAYRNHNYVKSVEYFNKAITSQRYSDTKKMALSDRQQLNAQLYLTNSALHVAKESQENLAKISAEQIEELPGYEFSGLFDTLSENESFLHRHAFYKETELGRTTCSKNHCEEMADDTALNKIVLYFGDVETSLNYNGRAVTLSKRLSDVLRHLLTSSSVAAPANANDIKACFGDLSFDDEVQWASYRQTIRRIRQELNACAIPDVIETAVGRQAYYFNGSVPFIIFYRVDDETE